MIGVIDYGAGNLGSVMNAFQRLNVPARFVSSPDELVPSSSPFEKIVFPGDGHFASAMESLNKSCYAQSIKEWIKADKPFLGICIGLQLLFETSQEAPPINGKEVKGLCVIPGSVKRFPGRKVPQIGWNRTIAKNNSKLFKGLNENSFFYYIHSYYADPLNDDVNAAEAEYYLRYCSAIECGALAAVQFHPEKSGIAGLELIKNWVSCG